MAKKRKTREQKKLADLRHNFTHVHALITTPSFDFKKQLPITKIEANATVIYDEAYPYLKKDLSKTALLTLGILAFQIILFMSLKNHIFVIPGLAY